MKKVIVLRHADWDAVVDALTQEGKEQCLRFNNKFGTFDVIISSPKRRSLESARLLTGRDPVVDDRASVLRATEDQGKQIAALRKTHPQGIAGALFSIPDLKEPLKEAGCRLIDLAREILGKLSDNGQALIISHDGTMNAAVKILNKDEDFSNPGKIYSALDGFVVDEETL